MMNLTNVQQKTSDQHCEFQVSRQTRDCADTKKIIEYFKKSNPFQGDPNVLRNIATGMSAADVVNIDSAKSVGDKILAKMKGKSVKEFIPRCLDQCVLMTSKMSNREEKHSHIDPALLYSFSGW